MDWLAWLNSTACIGCLVALAVIARTSRALVGHPRRILLSFVPLLIVAVVINAVILAYRLGNDGVFLLVGSGALLIVIVGMFRFQFGRTWTRSFLWALATLLVFVAVVFVESAVEGR